MAKKRVKTDAVSVILREIRHEKGLSQETVAARLDVARTYISYLESGQRYPSVEMLIALATALEIRPGEILDRVAGRIASGKALPIAKQVGPLK